MLIQIQMQIQTQIQMQTNTNEYQGNDKACKPEVKAKRSIV